MEQLKEGLEKEIKRIQYFLKKEENVGVINYAITYHEGMLKAYENTLNEINDLLEQLNK